MRAAICTGYGTPDVLRIHEVDQPTPKEREVLIKIHAASVSSGDVRTRSLEAPVLLSMMMRVVLGWRKPRRPILGTEMSGEVVAAGKGVKRYKPGDRVFAFTGMKFGGYAEFICLREDGLIAMKPDHMSYEEAAGVLFGGTSALHFLHKAGIRSGADVLIYGASGSVGTSAVQLARYYGARVTGVCSTGNVELVRSLGADTVIDYKAEDFRKIGKRFDIVLDAVGKIRRSDAATVLAPGGRFVSVASGLAKERIEDVNLIRELLQQGKIQPVIDRVYTLEQIQEAHRYVQQGHKRGNVIIRIQ